MAYTLRAQPGIGLDIAKRTAPAPIYDFVQAAPKAGAGAASKGDPWWMDALNALGAPGGLVTNQIESWTDGNLNWKDFGGGLVEPLGKGAKAQWDNWWSGGDGFGFEDIPLLGTLTHINNQSKHGADILANAGVTNKGWQTWGGLGIDILSDPLTWVTLGGSSALKAGNKAMNSTARNIGKEMALGKVTYKNVADKAGDFAYNNYLRAYKGDTAAATTARNQVMQEVQKELADAGAAARYKAQNALVNFDVPFTNTTFQFGRKPKALQKNSPKLATHGANVLRRNLDKAGLVGHTGDAFIQKALGKSSLEDVTYQEYNWLKGEIARYGDHAAKNPVKSPFGDAAPVPRAVDPADTFQFGKFVPDMGGVSQVGAKLGDAVRAINPRAMGTRASGGIVNSYGDHIQDAFGAIRGSGREFDRLSVQGRQLMDNLTPVEQKAVEYMLEAQDVTKIPGIESADLAGKVAPAAKFLRDEYQKMAQAEGGVGALDNVREAYAPHIINRSPEQLQEILQRYADDPELQRLSQVSGVSGFDQSRKSFQTLAQLDNYLANLGDEIARATDPEQIARLTQKQADVSTLFERNPLKAFQKRLHKSFKTREMAGLYRRMEEDGILITPDAPKGYDPGLYAKLDKTEAAKLGVAPGTVMHKEVKEGLLKINDLFTEQGLNKFLDHATAVTNIWKGLVTAARPVHHFNNLIGNILNNSLAGIGPKSYTKATGTLNRMLRGKPKQEDLDIMAEAMKKGVFGQNHSDEYRRVFGDMPANKLRKVEQAVTGNKYMNFMRKWMGDSIDNWSRLAHYIDVKGKTGSADLASQSVRKYLFNYGEQTKADRAIRLAIPFWNWTKRNIPLQIENMAKQPRFAATYMKLQDASFESRGESRTEQPDFISEGYFINPLTGQLRNPRAPVTDLTNLSDPLKFLTTSTNPLIKTPFELAANRNVFTGQPIDRELGQNGQYSSEALLNYGMSQAGLFNDFYKMFNGDMGPLDAIFGRELDLRRE